LPALTLRGQLFDSLVIFDTLVRRSAQLLCTGTAARAHSVRSGATKPTIKSFLMLVVPNCDNEFAAPTTAEVA
jgi:hypothetical protein